jgi:N-acylneuraminate cytidylyltransferase
LFKDKYDSLYPVIEYSFPIQRALKLEDNVISMFDSKYLNSRSQDLESSYHDAGQFYWMVKNSVLNQGSILTSNSGAYIISELEGQDIDNKEDWDLAILKYKLKYK